MKAIILAAGYATRLYPLTINIPKPLLDMKGKPIISHILDKVNELGVEEIFVVTNEKFFANFKRWADSLGDSRIRVISDGTSSNEERLGAIGDVSFVLNKENIKDDLLIIAGDNLFSFSLKLSYDLFKKTQKIVNPLYDVKDFEAAKALGTVVTDSSGKFLEFYEKSPEPKTTLASLAIYFFPKEKLHRINQYIEEGNSPDKIGNLIAWVIKHEDVLGNVYEQSWFDIGLPESLEEARRNFEA